MSFQLSPELNPELKSTMSELGYDWIRLHYTEVNQYLEEMKCDEDDEDNEAHRSFHGRAREPCLYYFIF